MGSKPRSRFRRGAVAAALMLAAAPWQAIAAQDREATRIFRIATASEAGTFYPIGRLIAQSLSAGVDCGGAATCGVPGLIALAQVSNGSVANVEAVSSGAVEAGLAQADVIYWAYNAIGRFAGRDRLTGMRALANLFPGSLHIVTAKESGIAKVDNLRDKRVALDEQGSGTLATAEAILASVGIAKADLHPYYVKHNHAGPMLAQGKLDAFFFVAGYPTGSVLELARQTGIQLVPLASRTIEKLVAERPYFAPGVIPAGSYPGLADDVATVDIGTQLIVGANFDEQLAYDITAALWSDRTRALLDEGHPKGRQVRLKTALSGVAIPLHPGAERFYREVGVIPN